MGIAGLSPLVLTILVSTVLGAEPVDPLFDKPVHYNVENSPIVNRLGRTPSPMVDWGFVLAGHIDYVDRKNGQKLPLNDAHEVDDPKQVEARPIAVPYGIQLRAQAAQQGGTFSQELFPPAFPWEESCTVHTMTFDEVDQRYKLWYRTKGFFAFAESADFRKWDRPLSTATVYDSLQQTNLLGILDRESIDSTDLKNAEEARLGYAGGFCIDSSAPAGERYKTVFLAHLKGDTADYAKVNQRPLSAMTGPGSKSETIEMFKLFANLISMHLDSQQRVRSTEAALLAEQDKFQLRD